MIQKLSTFEKNIVVYWLVGCQNTAHARWSSWLPGYYLYYIICIQRFSACAASINVSSHLLYDIYFRRTNNGEGHLGP